MNNKINELYKTIEAKDKIIDSQALEIARLNEKIDILIEDNKQLEEQLENDIDRYEDTISYQLGFDKGKEYLQQRIDNATEYIKNYLPNYDFDHSNLEKLLEILGDKENE